MNPFKAPLRNHIATGDKITLWEDIWGNAIMCHGVSAVRAQISTCGFAIILQIRWCADTGITRILRGGWETAVLNYYRTGTEIADDEYVITRYTTSKCPFFNSTLDCITFNLPQLAIICNSIPILMKRPNIPFPQIRLLLLVVLSFRQNIVSFVNLHIFTDSLFPPQIIPVIESRLTYTSNSSFTLSLHFSHND